ncbi:phosphate ABC transporter substrate-binding protein PstS [Actinotalea sp. Marseille-Q4924]|uniref:phosphate ABC transporter substrate-binding protein PstS n=1 Tax=Actinotalea sp. Marseille-Q4924 TaxID=2866571 RepID=UPI001CE47848|nr:phosphate ABC transporter substrate-binding protein PstS [Actinotalea sp. Marseille-Q4924]
MKLQRTSRIAPLAAVGVLALTLTACGSDAATEDPTTDAESGATGELSGQLSGAGASSQESAMQAWIAGFGSANPDVTVAYDPVGSGGGRTQFVEGGVAFAGSDAALDEEETALAAERCAPGDAAELPLYISPIAVMFNLPGVESLNMTPQTVAGIFAGEITQWDAPEIAADNPDVELPDLAITPVNRSDESGTTENFTEYLAAAAADAWPHEASGDWPISGTQSAQGTSGVVQTVTEAEGAVTYADASRAGSLGTVAVQVGDEFVPYSPEAAAAVVDASPLAEGRGEASLVRELERDTTAAGTYPIVLVSYSLACTTYEDPATAELVKAFLTYVASEEGQEQAAGAAGSAPISEEMRANVMEIVEQIS